MNKKRYILEIILFVLLIVVSFFTKDIQNTFLGITQVVFIVGIVGIYIFFRELVSLIVSTIKYKTSGNFKNYKDDEAKIYFENSVYLKLSIIFFIMIFMVSTLTIAFILLFLIFGILWLLSKLLITVMENKNGKKKKVIKNTSTDYLETYGNMADDFYNFVLLDYYSDLGFEFFKILTDNTFGILNNYKNDNSIVLLDKLSKSNYLFLVPRSLFFGDVNLLCGVFNSYLKKLEIKCKITPEEIIKKDSDKLSNRRCDYMDTLCNDLGVIDEILKKKKYRVISIGVDDSSETYLCLSVVSNNVYRKIMNFKNKYFKE